VNEPDEPNGVPRATFSVMCVASTVWSRFTVEPVAETTTALSSGFVPVQPLMPVNVLPPVMPV